MINLEYIRTLKSLVADFIRDNETADKQYYQEVWDWLDSLSVTSLQHELPGGLDEAAKKYADEVALCDEVPSASYYEMVFKAGAEWMAGREKMPKED